jgi:putative salt-induced outer membrane protein YdiY
MFKFFAVAAVLCLLPSAALAQDPAQPAWTGSIGAGLAFTSGNTDTSNINASFKVVRDPKTRTLFAAEGLYIRGSKDGELSADNALFGTRVERKLGAAGKAFWFGKVQFLRDTFKAIDAYWAPTAGVGYTFYDGPKGRFSADASVGASFEQNPGRDWQTNAVIAFGQKLVRNLSKTAAFTQSFAGNVVADDWGDGLYAFTVGVAASMTTRTQLKLEVVDTFKNRPSSPGVKQNDVSTVVAVVYTF